MTPRANFVIYPSTSGKDASLASFVAIGAATFASNPKLKERLSAKGRLRRCPAILAALGEITYRGVAAVKRERRRGKSGSHRFCNKHALAMVTYLRAASSAMATASGSERPWRTLANLTSIGRLIPASTSTFGRL